MTNDDDQYDDEITVDQLRALRAHVAPEIAKIEASSGRWHTTSLFDLAAHDVPPATLLAGLLEDPATARLLVAWRRSIAELKAAEAAAEVAGEHTVWFDISVTAANDEP